MSGTERRVSLSRRHLENKLSDGSLSSSVQRPKNNLLHKGSVNKESSTDALQQLDKLGLPRTSSLGESFEDDALSYTEDEISLDYQNKNSIENLYHGSQSGAGFVLPNGVYFEPSDDEYVSDSHSFTEILTNNKISVAADSSTSRDNSLARFKNEVRNEKVIDFDTTVSEKDENGGDAVQWQIVNGIQNSHQDDNNNKSSGESGCDTEGTVKAFSETGGDLAEEYGEGYDKPTAYDSRELMESGFNEEYLRTPSVYEEEAVINIQRGQSYEDSDSEGSDSVHDGGCTDWSSRQSCSSVTTGYPDNMSSVSYRTKNTNYPDSLCSSRRSSYAETDHTLMDKPKKSKLLRRPHVKSTESPLLRRKSGFGEMEMELERPVVESRYGDGDDEEEDDDEEDVEAASEVESESPIEIENFEQELNEDEMKPEMMFSERQLEELQSSTCDISDSECLQLMQRTVEVDVSRTKWSKTKEQILKLLKERLVILKKVIHDKNSQIRHLKSRLKEEQQHSQSMMEKLKVKNDFDI